MFAQMLFLRGCFQDGGRNEPQNFRSLNDAHHGSQHQVAQKHVSHRMPQQLHDPAHLYFDQFILGVDGRGGLALFRLRWHELALPDVTFKPYAGSSLMPNEQIPFQMKQNRTGREEQQPVESLYFLPSTVTFSPA
jgi:hypothetical protein